MATNNTSILLLFLGVAALFFLAAEAAGRPAPATVPVINVCTKTPHQHLCETTVKNKSDPFEATLSSINKSILVSGQAEGAAGKSDDPSGDDYASEESDEIYNALVSGTMRLVDSIKYLKAKDIIILQAKLDGGLSATYLCLYEKSPSPPPLKKICKTLQQLTENSLALSSLLH